MSSESQRDHNPSTGHEFRQVAAPGSGSPGRVVPGPGSEQANSTQELSAARVVWLATALASTTFLSAAIWSIETLDLVRKCAFPIVFLPLYIALSVPLGEFCRASFNWAASPEVDKSLCDDSPDYRSDLVWCRAAWPFAIPFILVIILPLGLIRRLSYGHIGEPPVDR
jgi:hypothetical protein